VSVSIETYFGSDYFPAFLPQDFEQSRQRYPGVKSFVVGMSLGGMMAAQVAASTTVHGAVLIAPAIVIDPRTASPALVRGATAISHFVIIPSVSKRVMASPLFLKKICMAHCVAKCCPLAGLVGIKPEYMTHDQEKVC
jgi:pimeloyl-ACP methyl ester carboxylesterase